MVHERSLESPRLRETCLARVRPDAKRPLFPGVVMCQRFPINLSVFASWSLGDRVYLLARQATRPRARIAA